MSGRARPDEPLATWCEVKIPGVCRGRATARHHRLRRSQRGTDDRVNTIDVCDPGCHNWIHANPAEAYARGWLLHSWETVT